MLEFVLAAAATIRLISTVNPPSWMEQQGLYQEMFSQWSSLEPFCLQAQRQSSHCLRLQIWVWQIHSTGREHYPWSSIPWNSVWYWLSTQPHLQVIAPNPQLQHLLPEGNSTRVRVLSYAGEGKVENIQSSFEIICYWRRVEQWIWFLITYS